MTHFVPDYSELTTRRQLRVKVGVLRHSLWVNKYTFFCTNNLSERTQNLQQDILTLMSRSQWIHRTDADKRKLNMVIFRFVLRTETAHVSALTYIHIYIYIYTHTHTHTHTHVYIYIYIYKLPVRNIVLEFEVKSTFLPLRLSVTQL